MSFVGLIEFIKTKTMIKIFVLIWIHRGHVQEPEFYFDLRDAEQRLTSIQKELYNPDYDEVRIFEKVISLC